MRIRYLGGMMTGDGPFQLQRHRGIEMGR